MFYELLQYFTNFLPYHGLFQQIELARVQKIGQVFLFSLCLRQDY